MTANPAFKYPAIVKGHTVKVVKTIGLDAQYVGEQGTVRAVHGIAGLNIEVWFEGRGHAALFAEEELAVQP